jgi:ATP-binding protein involved in chromosome partitioning
MSARAEEKILDALKRVLDPYHEKDIVTLGFVKEAALEGGRARVRIALPTPAYPPRARFEEEARSAVRGVAGVTAVDVEVTGEVLAPPQTFGSALPGVKHVIAVASGKGGVGKSTIAANLAVALAQYGASVGLLDADIYGPSIPIMFGERRQPKPSPDGKILPLERYGVRMMSIGFIATGDTPVIWRGPLVARMLQQFLQQVEWGPLDYLVIDLPPGTGDAQLTLAQSTFLSGAVIVTTPQDVALEDVYRAVRMFGQVRVPIIGIVENMSGFVCPHCGKATDIFRSGGGRDAAERVGAPLLGQVPLDQEICEGGDAGVPIVVANPENPRAAALRAIAGEVAARLALFSWQEAGA